MLREEHQFHVTPDSWLRAQGEDGVRHWMRPPVIEWMSEVCGDDQRLIVRCLLPVLPAD
jgi:hypothetical protein